MGNDDLERYSVNLASSCLSLFGSAAIILNYIIFANKSQLLYKLIFFLSLTDFGGSLAICISQVLLFLHTYDGLGYGLDLCKVFRALINFFFVSSFFWTSGISLHIWICAKQKAQIPIYWFHLVCWGLPAIFTSVLLGANMITQTGGSSWCSNTSLGHWLFWYSPLLFSFTWNAIAYTLILLHYRRDGPDRSKMKDKIKLRISLYLFVFFICWIWDVINFSYEQSSSHHTSPNWLKLLTSAFMPLQGFLNFLVYGISSRMFRRTPQNKQKNFRRPSAIPPSPLLHSQPLSHSLSLNHPLTHPLSNSPSYSNSPYATIDERRALLSP